MLYDEVVTELERKVRMLLSTLPHVPIEHLQTTGEFWLAVMRLRTEIKIIDACREEQGYAKPPSK